MNFSTLLGGYLGLQTKRKRDSEPKCLNFLNEALQRLRCMRYPITKTKICCFYSLFDSLIREIRNIDLVGSNRNLSSQYIGNINIVFNFMIIDAMPLEHLWRKWLSSSNNLRNFKAIVLIHAKYPNRVQSDWVKNNLVKFHEDTSWGSVGITKVMIGMLNEVKLC